MKIITVNDPEDKVFPLDKETYFDPAVYYHGTSRAFSGLIESSGFKRNGHAYDMDDMVELYNALKDPYFDSILTSEKKYQKQDMVWTVGVSGEHVGNKAVSFTGSWWNARGYAIRNHGGETISHGVKIVRWFLELPSCPHLDFARRFLKKYEMIVDGHIPCIYVVRLPPEEDWKDFENTFKKVKDEQPNKSKNKDLFAKNDIPKESIIARVDIPVDSKQWRPQDDCGPAPVPWD